MISISSFRVIATSLVSKEDLQKIVLQYECSATAHLFLSVYKKDSAIINRLPIALDGGSGELDVMLPVQTESFDAVWTISDKSGNILVRTVSPWKKPREWTLYIMVSSHTDIGLHNSQYVQRYNSSKFIDAAAGLCDKTENLDENDRYRYTMEGTWFWNNYGMDRGKDAADRIVKDYIKTDKIGVCAGVAGNHIQTYGLEEMCRSTYEKRRLFEDWGIESKTLSMIDNNGLAWSLIQPYAQAGYKNIIFAPNQWNPLPSTVWQQDPTFGAIYCPDANGGGSRMDMRYTSSLPMVFNWENSNGERMTVWGSAMYSWGGSPFGLYPDAKRYPQTQTGINLASVEQRMWQQLERLESKCPYDLWLLACYTDDQSPDECLIEVIQSWNAKWQWPKLRTLGNPDEPFELLRQRFGDQIPVLKGDMTGGWYQHPLTVPELMSQKFHADRALPNAEKWATVAGMTDREYRYPATDFRRAWDYLLFNDEHSYGTSGYTGRRVYETWMQHRDWINKASETAKVEGELALRTIASHVKAGEASTVIFNPTAQERTELIVTEDRKKHLLVTVPSFGYRSVPESRFVPTSCASRACDLPPMVENDYYIIRFCENGSMCSIYDKELGKELLDVRNRFRANELVYTSDNHNTFVVPGKASFELCCENERTHVTIRTEVPGLGATVVQTVTLPHYEKSILIDNGLYHVRDMVNRNRYYRYLYYAFPFQVENCRRLCHL
ncbi:MAG: hypothetical protein IJX62_05185, partial [Clostridia bacterium]|nr:hypothetical protein [Clostridia bacterium]